MKEGVHFLMLVCSASLAAAIVGDTNKGIDRIVVKVP